ncbi:hypothetical protein KKE03_03530 [Patescibacteria group bacterium]|nr:hypothetical protein [Patescibacteria group bacterium]
MASIEIKQQPLDVKVGDFAVAFKVPLPVIIPIESVKDTESEEITDPFATLSNLVTKAAIMSDMLEKGQVEQLPFAIASWFIRKWWVASQMSDGHIEGLDFLQRAIRESRVQRKRVIFTPAHLADFDHAVAFYVLEKNKQGLGIEKDSVWMAGTNMQKRPAISRFTRAAHLIYNVTPRDMRHLQTLKEKVEEYGFTEGEKDLLGAIQVIFNATRDESKQRVMETCGKKKKALVAYPEAGRAYDGFLKDAPPEFSWFYPRDGSAIVVPYRVYGARELNPPGIDPPIARIEMLPFWPKQKVYMKAGQHYPSSEIWRVWKARRVEGEEKASPMDWVMANLANVDPRFVRSNDCIRYGRLLERFAPDRVNNLLN